MVQISGALLTRIFSHVVAFLEEIARYLDVWIWNKLGRSRAETGTYTMREDESLQPVFFFDRTVWRFAAKGFEAIQKQARSPLFVARGFQWQPRMSFCSLVANRAIGQGVPALP